MLRITSSVQVGSLLFGWVLLASTPALPAAARDPVPPLLSQASPQSPLLSGTQVMLNGRSLPVPWSQWRSAGSPQVRTGIVDWGVTQMLGVEWLNAAAASQQPVQWFSDAVQNPLVLLTRIAPPFRYLDVTELGKKFGWQMQVSGTTLQIVSPPANVLAIRQGKQSWGDRIVLDLDRSAPWQVDEAMGEAGVTLDAAVTPAISQAFKSIPGNFVQTLRVEPGTNQTRLRLTTSARFRVWSLANPNRLIIDVRPDALVDQDIQWAPGLRWRRQTVTLGSNRFPVLWLEVNPRQPGLTLQPILPSATTLVGTAPLAQTARQTQATAAINAGFFNRNNQLPLGTIRQNGRWRSGPILGRGAIGWDAMGSFKLGRLTLQETVITPTGQRFALTHLNSAYLQAGIARYTADWGATYAPLTDAEILITVQNNQVVAQQTVAAAAGLAPVPIPANGYVLVLRSNAAAAAAFPVGTVLRLERSLSPPDFDRFPTIIAAGPLLLQNRQVVLDADAEKFSKAFIQELAARSAIGLTPNGTVILATVHTRIGGGGASLNDMAQLMLQLGATDALNLDGGSSTTLYLGGQIRDRLPRSAARVHNGIGIFLQPGP
jgi:Phosphodiester glycosidase